MDVVHGDVVLELNDKATPELRRVEAEYRAGLARIDAMEAEAKIGADTSSLDTAIKQAKDRVRILEGQMHADAQIGADTSELMEKLAIAHAEVKQLDGLKAEIEIGTRGDRQTLATLAKVRAAEAQRAAAQQRYMATAEKAAYRENEIRRRSALNAARDEAQMIRLAQKWSKLTDEVEKADRAIKQMPFRTEKRVQLEVDRARAMADMELVKKEMEFRGGHPPVKIRVDTDTQRAEAGMGRIKRALFGLRDSAVRGGGRIFDALGNVGALRVFGNRLSSIVKIASVLAPVLTSVAGAATGLVGVLGTGLAGAAAIAGGALAGLTLNLGGVVAMMHPAIDGFKEAHAATKAYQLAVDKYGASSDKAAKAQAQMHSVLRAVSPQAAQAARALASVSAKWRMMTQETGQRDTGKLLTGGIKTLNAVMPAVAANSTRTFDIITAGMNKMFKGIRQNSKLPGGGIIGSLGRSANAFLEPAIAGATHLGAALARIAESAARLFAGPAGRGFEKWVKHFDDSTKNSDKLDATITRIGTHATDLLHFFGALGRLIGTVFNGGADSGDRMVNSMTKALNRWNEFLKSPRGQTSMADFFKRAEGGARALWGALGPLIGAFVQWSSLLAPFTSGLLKGVGFVARLVAGFTKLIGAKGSLATLGATLGVAFAVSKVAGFVGMLARVVGLLRTAARLAKAGQIADAFKSLGNIGGALKGKGAGVAGQIETAGAAAGREMATQIEAAGTAVAAEMRTAMQTGGATAATEVEGGHAAGGRVAAEEIAAGEAAGGRVAAEEIAAGEAAGGRVAAGEIAAGAAAGGGGGLLGGFSKGLLGKVFKFGSAAFVGSLLAQHVFHNSNMDPLAFMHPDAAGGPGDTVSTSPSLLASRKRNWRAWGGKAGAEAAAGFESELEAHLSGDKAKNKAYDTFQKISRTAAGRKFVATLNIVTKGDEAARKTIAHLAGSKLGAKLLTILSRGGPEAVNWLAQISHSKLGQKLLDIVSRGGPDAQKLLAALSDKKVRDKVFKIIQHGGPAAERQLNKLLGIKIPHKNFQVKAHDAASAVIHGIRNAVGALHGKTITITTIRRTINQGLGSVSSALNSAAWASTGFRAAGGWARLTRDDLTRSQSSALYLKQQRAMDIAQARGPAQQRYGRFNRPTLLVGEEDRDEYVIATNPAYRKTNIKYLAQAAADLGVMVVQGAAKGQSGAYNPGAHGYNPRNPFRGVKGGRPFGGIAGAQTLHYGLPGFTRAHGLSGQLHEGTLGQSLAGVFNLEDLHESKRLMDQAVKDQEDAYAKHTAAFTRWRNADVAEVKKYNKIPDKHRAAKLASWKRIKRDRDKWTYEWNYAHRARVGGSVKAGKKTIKFKSLAEMRGLRQDISIEDHALTAWYGDRAHLISEANTAQSDAKNAATRYENRGNDADLAEYHRLMKIHDDDYAKVQDMDTKAIERAQAVFAKFDQTRVRDLLDALKEDSATTEGELLNIDDLTTDPAFAGQAAPSFDQYLGTHGAFEPGYRTLAEQQAALELAYNKSRFDDTADPTTHLINETTSKGVMDFYQSVVDQLARENAPSALQNEAAQQFISARDTYLSEQAAAHPAADPGTSMGLQLSTADTERQNVLAQYGSNIRGLAGLNPLSDPAGRGMGWAEMNPAMLAPDYGVIGGGSGISTRGAGGSSGSVHVTNHFGAPPPDPHTWSQGVKFEIGALL